MSTSRHHEVEQRLRELVSGAGLPQPDEVAHLRRAVAFLWYETKAFVLVDLEEIPDDEDPLEGLDTDLLAADILGGPLGPSVPAAPPGLGPSGFAETG
jgi:hypothetical protein